MLFKNSAKYGLPYLKQTFMKPKSYEWVRIPNVNMKHFSSYQDEIKYIPSEEKIENIRSKYTNPIKGNLGKILFVQEFVNKRNLASMKAAFLEDPTDPQKAFFYFRECNRNEKYGEVLEVYNQYARSFVSTESNKDDHRKMQKQFEYAKSSLEKQRKKNMHETQKILLDVRAQAKAQGSDPFRRLLPLAILFFLLNRTMEGGNDISDKGGSQGPGLFGNIFGKFVDNEGEVNVDTRFSDVLGIDEFKEELEELVDYLKNPQKYTESGAKIPKGILLVGPPGTGKTLLARALAGEAGCSFFYKSGSEFDEMFVGLGSRRVRELFKKARQKAPSIIFLDEIDSMAGTRKAVDASSSRDTLNQILAEMDGFKQHDNVIVIGATNLEKAIDPAIKRPGRFDKTIHIPLPDLRGRTEIFKYYLSKIKADDKIDPEYQAKRSTGMSGADIKNLVNLAIIHSIKVGRRKATVEDFEFAADRIRMGVGRHKLTVTDKEKLMTAYHEGGHALTSLLTEGSSPLHKVTILPRGQSLGHTSYTPSEDQESSITKKEMLAMIDVAMGGRIAEELLVGGDDYSTGWGGDLKTATRQAYSMVRNYAMSDQDKFLIAADSNQDCSEYYNSKIDEEVQRLLNESMTRVRLLLTNNKDKLETLAQELIAKETISADEARELLGLPKMESSRKPKYTKKN